MDPTRAQDRSILMNFYQLNTLDPKSYQNDTIPTFLPKDYSDDLVSDIPKEIINKLLNTSHKEPQDDIRPRSNQQNLRASSDYSDALGFTENIKETLLDMDVIEDTRDPTLYKYMVDSKLFNPKLFLSTIHADKTLNELKNGISILEKDIEMRKPALQKLITNNFEKTLTTKNSLDKVFSEFKNSSLDKKINNLEDELAKSNNSANQLLNPVLLQVDKENEISNALEQIRKNKQFLNLPKIIMASIEDDDFDSIMINYKKGKFVYNQLTTNYPNSPLYSKVWSKVEEIMKNYQSEMFKELDSVHIETISPNFKTQVSLRRNTFVTLVKRLVELDSLENPIKYFIKMQYSRIIADLDKGLASIKYDRLIVARNSIINAYQTEKEDNLFANESLTGTAMRKLYKLLTDSKFKSTDIDQIFDSLDLPLVVEIWGFLMEYVNDVTTNVIKRKILKFEEIFEYLTHDFKDLLSSNSLTNSHLSISEDDRFEMRDFFSKIILKVCSRLEFVFSCTKGDLTSAIEISMKDGTGAILPIVNNKDVNSVESYGYIPVYSNAISTVCFSLELHTKIFAIMNELQKKSHIFHSDKLTKGLENTLTKVNENMILGSLATLSSDLKKLPQMENWILSMTYNGSTLFPEFIQNYYKVFIYKLERIYYQHFSDSIGSTNLLKQIHKMFLQSMITLSQSLVDFSHDKVASEPENSGRYYFLTIANLSVLINIVFPDIRKFFEKAFNSKVSSTIINDLFKTINDYKSSLKISALLKYSESIKANILSGIKSYPITTADLASRLASGDQLKSSHWVTKSLSILNEFRTDLESWGINKEISRDAVKILLIQIIKRIKEGISSLTDIGKDKTMAKQIMLDVSMIRLIMKKIGIDEKELEIISKLDVDIENELGLVVRGNAVLINCVLEGL
ncbi:exocyst subunit [Martiniozyma asiatica (nom. inval.)]|nr:exocyst subunit [Martiniozyma asiatica]